MAIFSSARAVHYLESLYNEARRKKATKKWGKSEQGRWWMEKRQRNSKQTKRGNNNDAYGGEKLMLWLQGLSSGLQYIFSTPVKQGTVKLLLFSNQLFI